MQSGEQAANEEGADPTHLTGFNSYPSAKFYNFAGFPASRGQRQRVDVISAFQALLFPWTIFCLIYACMSFKLHFSKPWLCYSLVGAGLFVALLFGWMAFTSVLKKVFHRQVSQPKWYIFIFCTTLMGWVLGILLGNLNFTTYTQAYYDYSGMNEFFDIDPSQANGQAFMDAARFNFVNNSGLDLTRSIGFKDGSTYCVAPVSIALPGSYQALPMQTYDFWAVGLDCCSPNSADFHCGAYANPNAHGGLRLLADNQRPFFRLAVQQAEATYAIKATHPLFLYWTDDPSAAMFSIRDEGYKYYLIGMFAHFGWQVFAVGLAMASFSKMG